MITVLCFALAAGLLWSLAAHAGRMQERRALAARRYTQGEAVSISAFEAELRRARGLRRLHPDPENAPVIVRARIRRR